MYLYETGAANKDAVTTTTKAIQLTLSSPHTPNIYTYTLNFYRDYNFLVPGTHSVYDGA